MNLVLLGSEKEDVLKNYGKALSNKSIKKIQLKREKKSLIENWEYGNAELLKTKPNMFQMFFS